MGFLSSLFGNNRQQNNMPPELRHDIAIEISSIIDVYNNNMGDYVKTFSNIYLSTLDKLLDRLESSQANMYGYLAHVMVSNRLQNLNNLGIIDLQISVIPPTISLDQTINVLGTYIVDGLLQGGIPQQYVIGNNTHLTEDFINSIKEKIG